MKPPVYLDYNATTPVDPKVLEAMLPFFSTHYGNASSKGHAFGWSASAGVEKARKQVATLIGSTPEEIVFTAGATESINMVLKGVAVSYKRKGNHIVTVGTEHSAVLEACAALEQVEGCRITRLGVDSAGRVDTDELLAALGDETILVSIMWANNETGVLQDIPHLASVVRARGVLFMTDATQAVGKIPVQVSDVDFLALSGHKFYAPKGIGALYIRRRSRLFPLVHGGGQEGGARGGTLNVPGIVGIGAAAQIALENLESQIATWERLRNRFEGSVREAASGVEINGGGAPRLPQTSNLCFSGFRSADLIKNTRDLAVSAGSACSSGSAKPSHVLKEMGLSNEDAFGSIRFSFGRFSTEQDVDFAVDAIKLSLMDLRETV